MRDFRRSGGVALAAAASSIVGCASLLLAGMATAAAAQPQWSDSFVARLEALALIETLNAQLLAGASATRTLEQWCAEYHLADAATLSARRLEGPERAPSAEQRARLEVGPREPVKYRRVELRCGEHVLSVAENWYVPGRLSAAMNRQLESSETPFGAVVRPLRPYRRTFAVTQLWSPLAAGWAQQPTTATPAASGAMLAIPAALFEHRALLYDQRNRPFAEVDEVYQREVLAFPQPRDNQ